MRDAATRSRRELLRWAGSGALVAFAGCSATTGGGTQQTARTDGTTSATDTGIDPSAIETVASEFKTIRTSIGMDDVMWGRVENTGGRHVAHLEAEARFRNKAGELLGTTSASIEGFESGGVWETYLQSFDDPALVADGELTITRITFGPPPDKPDTAAVSPESLRPAHETKTPTAAGEVINIGEETIDRLGVHAKFYAENGILLGTSSTDIVSLGPSDPREFEIGFPGYEERAAPRVASYHVSLAE